MVGERRVCHHSRIAGLASMDYRCGWREVTTQSRPNHDLLSRTDVVSHKVFVCYIDILLVELARKHSQEEPNFILHDCGNSHGMKDLGGTAEGVPVDRYPFFNGVGYPAPVLGH